MICLFWYRGKRIISLTVYNKTIIKLLINIDGMPIFNCSDQQLWPILMLVFDPDYESTPFVIAALQKIEAKLREQIFKGMYYGNKRTSKRRYQY